MQKLNYLFFFVLIFNFSYAQKNTTQVLDEALVKAKKENKHVFINYLTSSSKLSQKMKQQMKNEHFQSLISSNYIVVNINVSKEEASEYYTCSNPMKSMSNDNCEAMKFPFWYILDSDGNHIGTSIKDGNNNIGYPTTKEAISDFVQVIENTSDFKADKLSLITDSFNKMNAEKLYSAK